MSQTSTGITVTRLNTGLAHVRVSWSTVSEATSYEVFQNGTSIQNTTDTSVTIRQGLTVGSTYSFTVVSYNNNSPVLPSDYSTPVNITLSK